jgi:hypothetical protein
LNDGAQTRTLTPIRRAITTALLLTLKSLSKLN